MLPQWFKDYLSFHKTERNGIIVLIFILIGLITFNMYQRFFWKGDWEEMHLKYGPMIAQFQEETDSIIQASETPEPWTPKTRDLFKFDPNTLDSTGWVALGFSPKQSAAIIKYRNAGAIFRKPEDVKKLFVVDETRYQELKPFIDIQPIAETKSSKKWQNEKFEKKPKWEKPEYVPKNIELNTADSAMLVEIRGIGPFFARVIIEHRDKLGGYRTKNQVMEVYGMDSAKFAKIESEISVDSAIIRKININQATLKELVRHPYINFNQAKAIVNYRQQHGRYKNLQGLKKIHLIHDESFSKMAPYLRVD
jgi:competence protein ComEA